MCVCVFEGTAMWMDQHRSSKSTTNLVTSWNYIKRWLAISTNLKPINIITICTTISAHRLTQPCSGWHSRFNLNWQIVALLVNCGKYTIFKHYCFIVWLFAARSIHKHFARTGDCVRTIIKQSARNKWNCGGTFKGI